MSSTLKRLGTVLALLLLLLGAGALGYARWTRAIAEGDAAIAAGNYDAALTSYMRAESHFEQVPATRQLFKDDYRHVVANHLWALYRLGRYDATIEQAAQSPDDAAPHFWAGCAYFQKAQAEEESDAVLAWLSRAEEELRKAVQAAPDDWDTKYDYELTTRLAAAMRKEPKTPPKQMMQLLRPPTGAKPVRRVP